MCGMNSVKIKKIKVKKYNCDSVNGNLEKMAIGIVQFDAFLEENLIRIILIFFFYKNIFVVFV